MRGGGKTQPVLRLVAEPVPWATAGTFRNTAIVAGGVGIVLLILGFGLVELQVLRPLRAIKGAVATVASGEIDVQVPEDGPAEFHDLAADFNRMTSSLKRQRDDLEQQRAKLERNERMAAIGRLAAGVAHEVGNPLAATLGYIEFLADPRSGLAEDQRELLARIQQQTERIQRIVGQLLDYSRPTAREPEAVSLARAAEELADTLAADSQVREVQVAVSGDPTLRALADPGQLAQVLLNLGLNAARAARESDVVEPRIAIRVGDHEGGSWIEVQDNGPGVPEEVRAQVFEPFFTTRKAGEGTGLGLAISQGLIEGMDGSLTLLATDARAPLRDGEPPGATFRVELPDAGS